MVGRSAAADESRGGWRRSRLPLLFHSASPHGPPRSQHTHAHRHRNINNKNLKTQRKKGGAKSPPSAPAPRADDAPAEPIAPPAQAAEGRVLREWRSLGARVVEADGALGRGPEDAPDMFEGERFEALGSAVEKYFLPALAALGLLCGGVAAKTYDTGADVFIKTPTGPDAEPSLMLADKSGGPPVGAPALVGGR